MNDVIYGQKKKLGRYHKIQFHQVKLMWHLKMPHLARLGGATVQGGFEVVIWGVGCFNKDKLTKVCVLQMEIGTAKINSLECRFCFICCSPGLTLDFATNG